MARIKTFVNGGSLLAGDLNSIQDDYELGFSAYKERCERVGSLSTVSAGVYLLETNAALNIMNAANTQPASGMYLNPADFAASTRTVKLRVTAGLWTNQVAPGQTLTFGLYPIATVGGGLGATPFINSLGSVVAGSTVSFATPAASSSFLGNSGDFTAPAAGWYILGVSVPGSTAANSVENFNVFVQMRQV